MPALFSFDRSNFGTLNRQEGVDENLTLVPLIRGASSQGATILRDIAQWLTSKEMIVDELPSVFFKTKLYYLKNKKCWVDSTQEVVLFLIATTTQDQAGAINLIEDYCKGEKYELVKQHGFVFGFLAADNGVPLLINPDEYLAYLPYNQKYTIEHDPDFDSNPPSNGGGSGTNISCVGATDTFVISSDLYYESQILEGAPNSGQSIYWRMTINGIEFVERVNPDLAGMSYSFFEDFLASGLGTINRSWEVVPLPVTGFYDNGVGLTFKAAEGQTEDLRVELIPSLNLPPRFPPELDERVNPTGLWHPLTNGVISFCLKGNGGTVGVGLPETFLGYLTPYGFYDFYLDGEKVLGLTRIWNYPYSGSFPLGLESFLTNLGIQIIKYVTDYDFDTNTATYARPYVEGEDLELVNFALFKNTAPQRHTLRIMKVDSSEIGKQLPAFFPVNNDMTYIYSPSFPDQLLGVEFVIGALGD